MSLIQDALKRKREEAAVIPPPEAPPPAPPSAIPEPLAKKNKPEQTPTKLPLILIAIVLLILIAFGAVKLLRTAPPAQVENTKPTVVVKEPAPAKKEIEKTPEARWPKLKLTGFASGGGQRMVFINGKMLTEGREIDGTRIIQIGRTEVLVDYQGERRILRVDDE